MVEALVRLLAVVVGLVVFAGISLDVVGDGFVVVVGDCFVDFVVVLVVVVAA